MIVPDLNLLVYAYNASSPQHRVVAKWWTNCMNSEAFIAIPAIVHQGFVRIMTGRHVLERPYTPPEVISIVSEWYETPTVQHLPFTNEIRLRFQDLVSKHKLSGPMITDAVIAASALELNYTVYSNDTDFLRFEGLRISNPLIKSQ